MKIEKVRKIVKMNEFIYKIESFFKNKKKHITYLRFIFVSLNLDFTKLILLDPFCSLNHVIDTMKYRKIKNLTVKIRKPN